MFPLRSMKQQLSRLKQNTTLKPNTFKLNHHKGNSHQSVINFRSLSTKAPRTTSEPQRIEKFTDGFAAGWWLGGVGTCAVYIWQHPLAFDGGIVGFGLGAAVGGPLGGLLAAFPKQRPTIIAASGLFIGLHIYRAIKRDEEDDGISPKPKRYI